MGLSCASLALAARVAAAGNASRAPVYLMYNAWQRGAWSPSGASRWPYHGLDWQALGWGWPASYNALPSDLAEAAALQRLVGDFARGRGALPATWGWAPVTPGQPLQTLVFAQEGGWPGGGVRAVEGFKAAQCAALAAHLSPAQSWWWCD